MHRNLFTSTWIFFLIIGFSVSGYSATQTCLFLTDIDGESTFQKCEDWIEVLDWSWELNNNYSNERSLRNPTEILVGPLMVKKYVDKASPDLVIQLLTGKIIDEAILMVYKSGETPIPYLKMTLSNVIVSHLSPSISESDERIIEYLGLEFMKICYEYTPQKSDGSADAAIEQCWSR